MEHDGIAAESRQKYAGSYIEFAFNMLYLSFYIEQIQITLVKQEFKAIFGSNNWCNRW